MANHASHGALPWPVNNARYTVECAFLDADGDPTDPTTPDSEISKNNGAFADCAEEVTVATGGRGGGMLTLSGAETDASILKLWLGAASGPKATLMTLYPRVLPILESGTAQAGAAGSITLASGAAAYSIVGGIVRTTGGTGGGGTGGANNQARVITAYNVSSKVATVVPNWETNPASDTTYDILLTEMAVNALLANIKAIGGSAEHLDRWKRTVGCVGYFVIGNGSTTTSFVTSSLYLLGVADQLKGRIIVFDEDTTTANLRQQGTRILSHTVGGVITAEFAVTNAPANGDKGIIL